MSWWLVGAYIFSVVLFLLANQWESKFCNDYDVTWLEVVLSLIPAINVVWTFAIVINIWEYKHFAMPRWLYRLYGGK